MRGRVAFFRIIAPGACFTGVHNAYAMADGMLGWWNVVEASSMGRLWRHGVLCSSAPHLCASRRGERWRRDRAFCCRRPTRQGILL